MQFGLDASRAGILETPAAPQVAAALKTLTRPTDLDRALDGLVAAGLEEPSAICLVEELLVHGVLTPHQPAQVFLVGSTPLAFHLAGLLDSYGVKVRTPFADEDPALALRGIDPRWPVIVVDQIGARPELAHRLVRMPNPVLPVAVLDKRGLIGPARVTGRGPCLMCLELTWVRRDEHFHTVASQLADTGALTRQDPTTVAATAASTAAQLEALRGHPLAVGPALVEPGDCVVVDPYSPESSHRFRLTAHAGCPVCFDAEDRRVERPAPRSTDPLQRNWWSTPSSPAP